MVERNLENAERLISALSCVDGAVIIDRALGIRGFGYRLTAPSSKTSDLTGVGTRHRSASDFCRRVDGAMAFVVSQDGGVTLFSHNDLDHCDRIAVCLDPRRCDI
jgi:DNA integrity scanning protein DisA with diadenylate cyclase activity